MAFLASSALTLLLLMLVVALPAIAAGQLASMIVEWHRNRKDPFQ